MILATSIIEKSLLIGVRFWLLNCSQIFVMAARPANQSTLNFYQASSKLKTVNIVVHAISRVMGVERLQQLLRIAAILARESHHVSILFVGPLDVLHWVRR